MLDELETKTNASMEKFELLSAYLDGEVTMAERKQVEIWLQEDASFKAMHQKMRGMHTAIEQIPTPAETSLPVNKFADEVFAKIDRHRQFRLLKVAGASCVAGLVALGAVIAGNFQGTHGSQFQIAKISLPSTVPSSLAVTAPPEALMVALNDSIVQIAPTTKVPTKTGADILDLLDDGDEL
jgi:anti-sigma factor RsiW